MSSATKSLGMALMERAGRKALLSATQAREIMDELKRLEAIEKGARELAARWHNDKGHNFSLTNRVRSIELTRVLDGGEA